MSKHLGLRGEFTNGEISVREAFPEEQANWDKLIMQHKNYRLYHKQSWLRSLEAISSAKPLYLIFEKNGGVVACFPGFLLKIAFLRLFASPLEGWQTISMGPVFDPVQTSTHEIFSAAIAYLEKQHGIHHLELACANLDHDSMKELGFKGRVMSTSRVPLFPEDEQQNLKNIDGKTRNQLRKAIKLGLRAQIESEESFVDEFYDQMKEVFARHGNILPFSKNRVLHLFRQMKESGNLLAISVRIPESKICIATGLFLIERPELILWGWTHRAQYRWYCPTELLVWTAMQKAMEAGCRTFDMGGGGKAKVKFGVVSDDSVYRWIRSRYRWLFWLRELARRTFRLQQFLRGRLAKARLSLKKDKWQKSQKEENRGNPEIGK